MWRNKTWWLAAVVAAGVLGVGACSSSPGSPSGDTSPAVGSSPASSGSAGPTAPAVASPSPPVDPTARAAWDALMGPDGEYAAAASYQAVIDRYGPVEPYISIKAGEERHIEALVRQLGRFDTTAPANPYLGKIAAPTDLTSAAKAWADGEVANVAMYDELLIAAKNDPGLTRVFTNLRRASQEMHLPAFKAAADNGGQLTADQMDTLGFH